MPFLEPHPPTGLLEAMAGPSAVLLYHAKSKGFNTLNREILIAISSRSSGEARLGLWQIIGPNAKSRDTHSPTLADQGLKR